MAARIDIARALVIAGLPAGCGGKTREEGVTKSETGADSAAALVDEFSAAEPQTSAVEDLLLGRR